MKEKINIPLTPYVPENLVSRDGFSRSVPRQPAHLHTQAESGVYSRDSSRFPRRRPFIYLNRHTPLSQSRVYRVTQLRTNGVPVTGCCHFAGHHGPINVRAAPIYLFKPPYAIESVPSLSGHAIAYQWRSSNGVLPFCRSPWTN